MPDKPRAPRADAQRNRARILDVARTVLREQGTQASLRDIARRADVGMGTLYRHFPTRDELLEALLRDHFDRLATQAEALDAAPDPGVALTEWLRHFATGSAAFRGLPGSLIATLTDESSSLHTSCMSMRDAAGRLLRRAQDCGQFRPDVDGTDLFALVSAVSWIADQSPKIAVRQEHLLSLVLDGLRHAPA